MPPRSRLAPVVLALVIVLAGCGSLAGSSPGTPTETVTPAPLPADAEQLAPGLTVEGVWNGTRLGTAHQNRLAGQNYTVRTAATVVFENGTVFSEYLTERRFSPDGTGLVSTTLGGLRSVRASGTDTVETTTWTNGSQHVIRRHHENGTVSYSVTTPDRSLRVYTSTVPSLTATLTESDARVIDRSTNRTPATYTLTAPELAERPVPDVLDAVDRRTARLVVTENGLVQRVTVRQAGRLDGHRAVVNNTVSYHDIGTTTVERPPWLTTAREHETATARNTTGRNLTG